jgi:hypothetical protein
MIACILKDVTFGIRALAWVQELSWKLIYVQLLQNSSNETWHRDKPLFSEEEGSGCIS